MLGFEPDVFWSLTPKELHLAGTARMRDQRDWCLAQAWHTARLSLTDPKHFPSLQDLLGGERETVDPRDEVAQMMLARLQEINERNTRQTGEGG